MLDLWYGLDSSIGPSWTLGSLTLSNSMSQLTMAARRRGRIHAVVSDTPSAVAISRPSSIWKPGESALSLANGSASGLAHMEIAPSALTSARVRAALGCANGSPAHRMTITSIVRRPFEHGEKFMDSQAPPRASGCG